MPLLQHKVLCLLIRTSKYDVKFHYQCRVHHNSLSDAVKLYFFVKPLFYLPARAAAYFPGHNKDQFAQTGNSV